MKVLILLLLSFVVPLEVGLYAADGTSSPVGSVAVFDWQELPNPPEEFGLGGA